MWRGRCRSSPVIRAPSRRLRSCRSTPSPGRTGPGHPSRVPDVQISAAEPQLRPSWLSPRAPRWTTGSATCAVCPHRTRDVPLPATAVRHGAVGWMARMPARHETGPRSCHWTGPYQRTGMPARSTHDDAFLAHGLAAVLRPRRDLGQQLPLHQDRRGRGSAAVHAGDVSAVHRVRTAGDAGPGGARAAAPRSGARTGTSWWSACSNMALPFSLITRAEQSVDSALAATLGRRDPARRSPDRGGDAADRADHREQGGRGPRRVRRRGDPGGLRSRDARRPRFGAGARVGRGHGVVRASARSMRDGTFAAFDR